MYFAETDWCCRSKIEFSESPSGMGNTPMQEHDNVSFKPHNLASVCILSFHEMPLVDSL